MRDTGLADRLRAKGLTVKEVAGWGTRGNDGGGNPTFRPVGAINHHTAGSMFGDAPSLATVIYGRPDVPGPLAQVLQSREVDRNGLDVVYVVAAGKANHGGVGTWTGGGGTFDSNYESEGNEVEHTGTTTVHANRRETMARVAAAFLEAPGSSRDATMACQHFEYAQPPGRKIDFHDLAPWTTTGFRDRVRFWIGRNAADTEEDDDTVYVFARDTKNKLWLIDGQTRRQVVGDEDVAYVRRFFKPIQENGRAFTSLPDAWIHAHPDVGLLVSANLYGAATLEVAKRLEVDVAEVEEKLEQHTVELP